MSLVYSCIECGSNLNLDPNHLFPPDTYFEAGNKGTLSFSCVADATKFRFQKEDKILPFFETLDYWGIQRKRTKIKCNSCGRLLGHIYDDGPPMTDSPGQWHFGPSQVIPRAPRYRFKSKAGKYSISKETGKKENMKEEVMVESVTRWESFSSMSHLLSLPPLPRSWARNSSAVSVTKKEIERFWRQRQIEEEEHLIHAIKAAARIRARNITEADYKRFEKLLMDEDLVNNRELGAISRNNPKNAQGRQNQEHRVGIKDWWTRSKYAYLNLPAPEARGPPKCGASSETPYNAVTPLSVV